MMTKEERCLEAKKYHTANMNCAQCLLLAFRDRIGLTEEQCFGIASGAGAGFRSGNICGAVSGAIMVLGILHPHTMENGLSGKQRSTVLTKEFERRFVEKFGYLNCRELLAEKELHGTPFAEQLAEGGHCGLMIYTAIELLSDYLDELEKE